MWVDLEAALAAGIKDGVFVQAVRKALRGDGPPPLELSLFYRLERMEWKHLPYAGGLWDQPFRLMQRLDICRDELAKHQLYLQTKDKAMADLKKKDLTMAKPKKKQDL